MVPAKVSVITPLYNCSKYISKSIESIINQSYPNWELLICDDGSTDDSFEIAKTYELVDSRVKVIKNDVNCGNIYTYNRLFFESVGKYIAVQDADDWSDPKRLELQVEILEKNNIGICLTNSTNHYSDGRKVVNSKPKSFFIDMSFDETSAWPATMLFNRKVLSSIKGFHPYFTGLPAFDWHFVFSVINKFGGFYLNEYCYHVLIRNESDHRLIDFKNKSDVRKIIGNDIFLFLKKQLVQTGTDWLEQGQVDAVKNLEAEIIKNKKIISEKIRIFACNAIDRKAYLQSSAAIRKAIIMNPLSKNNYLTALYFIRTLLKTKFKHYTR